MHSENIIAALIRIGLISNFQPPITKVRLYKLQPWNFLIMVISHVVYSIIEKFHLVNHILIFKQFFHWFILTILKVVTAFGLKINAYHEACPQYNIMKYGSAYSCWF